jgi:ribosomal subunit interface protein
MLVRVQGTNLDLSDELYAFVTEKLDDAFRALGALDRDPVQVDVELEETTRRHPQALEDQRLYRAEANVTVPGRLIRAEGSADTLQGAVVEMKHHLTRTIREWREQMIDARREGARRAKVELGEEIEAGQYEGLDDDYEDRYVEELGEFGGGEAEGGEPGPDRAR